MAKPHLGAAALLVFSSLPLGKCTVLTCPASSQGSCQANWCSTADGTCIQVNDDQLDYNTAELQCGQGTGVGFNGQLASVHSQATNDLVKTITGGIAVSTWIGLDRAVTSDWRFKDHSAVTFTAWKAGEESNTEDSCTVLDPQLTPPQWKIADCATTKGYVCQYAPYTGTSATTGPTTTTTIAPAAVTVAAATLAPTTTTATPAFRTYGPVVAQNNLLNATFPGATVDATNRAWSLGAQPAGNGLQAWPMSGNDTELCSVDDPLLATTYADAFACGLVVKPGPTTAAACELACTIETGCGAYQWDPATASCKIGFGRLCTISGDVQPAATVVQKRIQHGKVRLLTNLTDYKVLHLRNMGVITLNPLPSTTGIPGALTVQAQICRNWCYSNLNCQYWQYGTTGCWVQDVDDAATPPVSYPLTVPNGATPDTAGEIQYGEYIQHYCPPATGAPATPAPPASGWSTGMLVGLGVLALALLALAALVCHSMKGKKTSAKSRAVRKTRAVKREEKAPTYEEVPLITPQPLMYQQVVSPVPAPITTFTAAPQTVYAAPQVAHTMAYSPVPSQATSFQYGQYAGSPASFSAAPAYASYAPAYQGHPSGPSR